MKKLYVNVEEVKIKGRPEALTRVVMDIDRRTQELASATELIKGIMYKLSGTNRGKQYKQACDAVTELSADVYDASEVLNDVQHQIIKFENKCHYYEGESISAPSPRRHSVRKIKVSVNTSEILFEKPQMIYVRNALDKYSKLAREECKKLRSNRDSIGRIWTDRQFKDFSVYIDNVCMIVEKGCRELDEYKNYLNERIKGM